MRKRLITPTPETIRVHGEGWLDVEPAALVEVTSEDKEFPVELAFASGDTRGWRAAAPGSQTIRLIFDHPQKLKRISVVFEENEPGARKSSCCDGLRMATAHSRRSCGSSGISARLNRYAKLRSIEWISRTLRYWN